MNSRTLTLPENEEFFDSIFPGLSQGAFDIIIDGPVGIWVYQASPGCLFVNETAKRLLKLEQSASIFSADTPPCLRHLLKNPNQSGLQKCQGSDVFSYLIQEQLSMTAGIFVSTPEPQSQLPPLANDEQGILKLLMQLPHLAVQGYDKEGRVIYWNEACRDLYGYSLAQARGKTMGELLIPQNQRAGFPSVLQKWLSKTGVAPNRKCIRVNRQGQKLQIQTTQIVIQSPQNEIELYCIDHSMEGAKQQQQQLHELEYYDQLTKLPNRQLMHSLLQQSMKISQQLDLSTAVMFIGIDKFKLVNSQYGHDIGDQILKRIADRILSSVSVQDLKARFGGDVYVLAFNLPEGSQQISNIANRLLSTLSEDLHLLEGPEKVTASIGIAISPHDGEDAGTLLKHGDAALAQAKANGGNGFFYFDPELNRNTHRVHFIAQDLKRALQAGELKLIFQPQFRLGSSEVCGSESLLRWQHKQLGEISPAEFIPILEQQQSMLMLDFWVTSQMFKNIKNHIIRGIRPPRTFANLSAATINHKDFQHTVQRMLDKHGIPCRTVGIELTEHVLINNEPQAVANLQWCRQKGIKIALDDFGTGFSSLSYLAKLPIDIIKIDKSFISAIEKKHNRELVKTIIAIAKSLSMEVICEGVQSEEQEQFLREQGCDMAQGHLYSYALDSEEWFDLTRQKLRQENTA
ncbi:sensor domain-containing phosphodiesterase [uncultured Pseudoteredinibacter sp.]|uniref:sensor domain-containing phosphodiesterase n=1 Tax=uncultured Pseudoteredinibacter sp. TaxID=1641701 RepID=UPI002606138C|nr:sensor domain-containing phosphodiesterase [uncultured Pseudoteredinibacter sp.]